MCPNSQQNLAMSFATMGLSGEIMASKHKSKYDHIDLFDEAAGVVELNSNVSVNGWLASRDGRHRPRDMPGHRRACAKRGRRTVAGTARFASLDSVARSR